MARDFLAAAKPHSRVSLEVIEEPRECAEAAWAADNATVQANRHHPCPALAP
jgi:hypothetical protein